MTAFGATLYRRHRDPRTWVQIHGREEDSNVTFEVGEPRWFWFRKNAERWARWEMVELQHEDAAYRFRAEMAALENGSTYARGFLP